MPHYTEDEILQAMYDLDTTDRESTIRFLDEQEYKKACAINAAIEAEHHVSDDYWDGDNSDSD